MNQLSQRFQVAADGRPMERCLLTTSILPNVILCVYIGSGRNQLLDEIVRAQSGR
jgi:hypothetical protein